MSDEFDAVATMCNHLGRMYDAAPGGDADEYAMLGKRFEQTQSAIRAHLPANGRMPHSWYAGLLDARTRYLSRNRDAIDARLEADQEASKSGRLTTLNQVIIGKVDVTKHVAAMFDALVDSLDWGSGFLDTEEVESILIVAQLMGIKTDDLSPSLLPHGVPGSVDAWKRQVAAKARAMAQDADEGEGSDGLP